MSTNKKITQLDELTPATWADDDVIAIVDISAQETKKIQLSTFRTAVGGVTTLTATTPLTVDTSLGDVTISVAISGGGTVNAVLDEDNMASNSPTALSTQQSIKAYVDSQIITVDSLSEVLALGNTTGGTDLSVSTGDDITFADNSKAIFGAGSDLRIYHNGTNSVIGDFGTGDLLIYGTDDVFIRGSTTSNYMARFAEEGAVTLYYDNAIKLDTTATGVDVTGTIVGDGLTLTTGATVTTVLDEDNMASNSATALATQQSIKAYVDAEVGTVDTLAEVLALGNTTGGTDIAMTGGDKVTNFTSTGIDDNATSTAITIDSSENVGIGTASPDSGTPLHVQESSASLGANPTSSALLVERSGNVAMTLGTSNTGAASIFFGDPESLTVGRVQYDNSDNSLAFWANTGERMRISSAGYVGIGTAAPASALTVSDGTASGLTPFGGTDLFLDSSGDNYLQFGSGTSSSPAIYFGDSADGDVGGIIYAHTSNAMSFRTNGSERMRINSAGNVGIGTSAPMGAGGYGWLTINGSTGYGGIVSLSQVDTELARFQSTTSSTLLSTLTAAPLLFKTSNAERMRISSTGLVGIGTSAPAEKLEVTGNIILDATDADIKLKSGGAGTTGALRWTFTTNSTSYGDISLPYDTRASVGLLLHTIGSYPITIDSGNSVIFKEDSTETMRIRSDGNVGIGTAAPAFELDVAGVTDPVIRVRATGSGTGDDSLIKMAVTNASASNYIQFGDASDADAGYIRYAHSTNSLIIATNAAVRMTINSSGSLLVGQSSSASPGFNNTTAGGAWSSDGTSLHLSRSSNGCAWFNRSTTTGSVQSFRYNGTGVGTISVTASATAYNTSSDYRLKENVVPLNGAIDRIKLLKPSRFNFTVDPDMTIDGFVAHEVSDVVPEAICGEKDAVDAEGNPEYQGIDQSKLVPLLTAALKEALTKIDSLETRITALEG